VGECFWICRPKRWWGGLRVWHWERRGVVWVRVRVGAGRRNVLCPCAWRTAARTARRTWPPARAAPPARTQPHPHRVQHRCTGPARAGDRGEHRCASADAMDDGGGVSVGPGALSSVCTRRHAPASRSSLRAASTPPRRTGTRDDGVGANMHAQWRDASRPHARRSPRTRPYTRTAAGVVEGSARDGGGGSPPPTTTTS